MSILGAAESAFRRREDVAPGGVPDRSYSGMAGAARGSEVPTKGLDTAVQMVLTYIPSEVVTLYVALIAVAPPSGDTVKHSPWWAFYLFLALTPVFVWLVYAAKVRAKTKKLPWAPGSWPLWEMGAALVAYLAWALAIPGTPFLDSSWYAAPVAGYGLTVASVGLPLLSKVFGPLSD